MAKKRHPDADDSELLMNIAKLSAVQLAKLEIHPKSAGSVHVTVGGPNLNSVSKTIKALQFYE